MSTKRLILNLCISLMPIIAARTFAQPPPIIVESTKINEEELPPSRAAQILTDEDFSEPGMQTVADALRTLPGVEVLRQGALGQTTSVFIRGARSEDTLVLVDGIIVNDVLSPANGFDFSNLSLTNISRIEVFKGPQSVRFGAGALGGVINIVTKKGDGKPKVNYTLETGSYQTDRVNVETLGSHKKFSYSLGAGYLTTDGVSSAAKKYGNHEKDGANVSSFSAKTSFKTTPHSDISMVAQYSNAQADIDTNGGPGGDDPNNTTKTQSLAAGLSGGSRFLEEHLKSRIGFYYSKTKRHSQNRPDRLDSTDSKYSFTGENKGLRLDNEYLIGEFHTLRGGLSFRQESGQSSSAFNNTITEIGEKSQSVHGVDLTYLYESKDWFYDLGTRADRSSKIGPIMSYRASAGRLLAETDTKIYLTYGTGYKLPSLYQLYSEFGNLNLSEESSETINLTLEQKIYLQIQSSISAFRNSYQSLIDFDTGSSKYFNISSASSKGFEIQIAAKIVRPLNLSASYVYLETKDALGNPLLRRPKHSAELTLEHQTTSTKSYVTYRLRGQREDIDPSSFLRFKSPSYDVIDIGSEVALDNSFSMFSKIQNLLNRQYEEVAGYGTYGLSLFFGIKGTL